MNSKFVDFKRIEFVTKVGMPVIVRMPVFWTDSILHQYEEEMKGAQKKTCVSKDRGYVEFENVKFCCHWDGLVRFSMGLASG
jgi:hypothetical protein